MGWNLELDFSLRNFYQWLGIENSLVGKACLDVEDSLGFCSVINCVMGFYNEVLIYALILGIYSCLEILIANTVDDYGAIFNPASSQFLRERKCQGFGISMIGCDD